MRSFIVTIFLDRAQQKGRITLGILALFLVSTTYAATIISEIHAIDGALLGSVTFEDSKYGLLIKPQLSGLPVGLHGFHIHQHPDCGNNGMSAGGHFDPGSTNSHQGPYGEGHLGDLPLLATNNNGEA